MKIKQEKKKRKRWKHTGERKTRFQYWTIDGNYTFYPMAYCSYYDGALTTGLMNTHRCKERKCNRLMEDGDFE